MQKDLASEPQSERDALFGRALGRILSHELYHVLAQTSHHASCGVAKSAFSVADLLADEFEFEKVEPARFHRVVVTKNTSPGSSASNEAQ